ncbi:MAG TPA: hypothetical protein VK969_02430, partial [Acidimicrobiia bacterium]|nr:hypothetical protein [Acidimicrobiia bacterium]
LQKLDLSKTRITSVPNLTGLGNTLLQLDLADIATMPAGPIPPSVTNLTSLTHLYLDGSNFNGVIPANIGSIGAQLSILDLDRNNLSGDLAATTITALIGLQPAGGLSLAQNGGNCFTFSDGVPPTPGATYTFVEAKTVLGEAALITCSP